MPNEHELAPVVTWRSQIAQANLPATTKHVALTLSLWMNEMGGSAFPSVDTLASAASLDPETIRRHLNALVADGWLLRKPRAGRGNTNIYTARKPGSESAKPPSSVGETPAQDGGSSPGVVQKSPTLAPQATRKRDAIFEALAEACEINWEEGLTKTARGRLNKAAQELREVGATPEDIRRRAKRYARKFPQVPITPQGLTGNWGLLQDAPKVATPEEVEREIERVEISEEDRARNLEAVRDIAEMLRNRDAAEG